MKTLTTSLIGFLLVLTVSGMTTFEKNYIRNYRESGKSVRQTSDGGYIIAAVSEFSQTYLIKTNPDGDTIWTKLYDGICYDILEETDGNFVLCGTLSGNALLRKVDNNGALVWAKSFGGTADEVAYSLLQTTDGGFMICGYTQSLGTVFQSVYCVRTDSAGDLIWEKFYSKLAVSVGVAIREQSGGDFLICGNADIISKSPTINQVVLIKINLDGDTLWTRDYSDGTVVTSFAVTADNGSLLCGYMGSIPSGNAVSLLNFDADGGFQWQKSLNLGNDDSRGNWIERANDDHFIITGTSDSSLFVLKADNAGDPLWTRFYNNSTIAKGNCIRQTSDGGYVVCGQSGSSTTSFSTYLIKTNDAGLLTGIDNQHNSDISVSTNPNPASDLLHVTFPASNNICRIQLIDLSGNIRLQTAVNPGCTQQTMVVRDLPNGCYIMKVWSSDRFCKTLKVMID